jgi:hypothetical protein
METRVIVALYFLSWTVGLAVAIPIGAQVTKKFLVDWLRPKIREEARKANEEEEYAKIMSKPLFVENWFLGVCERLFFVVLVAFNIPATAIAMIGWITLKMIYNWGIILTQDKTRTHRSLALSALLGNLFSMFFALAGGLICRIPFAFN